MKIVRTSFAVIVATLVILFVDTFDGIMHTYRPLGQLSMPSLILIIALYTFCIGIALHRKTK